jgi:toxin ParE1/3/4
MAKYYFTTKAIDDLSQIWNYTFTRWSENQADKYYRMLIENCQEIAENPELGKDYSVIIEDLKGFKAGRHIIFYQRNEGDKIEIARILHEQMDFRKSIEEK